MYKDIDDPSILGDEDVRENYYKISENTQEVDDIDYQIKSNEDFVRKNTIIHGKPKMHYRDQDDPNSIYKIEGLEFLPEGFLELDPLLYKDEYEFDNHIHENLFEEEQKRMKVLRRKQYTQRNQQKMRDVTIYVVDEHRDRILQYLDKWYFKNKRKMNDKELAYVAELLKVEPYKMKKLQDWYLQKKQIINTKKLRDYLIKEGKIRNEKIRVPQSLQHYFVKVGGKKVNDEDLPKSMRNQSPFDVKYYKKFGIKKLRKTPFSQRITPEHSVDENNTVTFDNTVEEINVNQTLPPRNEIRNVNTANKTMPGRFTKGSREDDDKDEDKPESRITVKYDGKERVSDPEKRKKSSKPQKLSKTGKHRVTGEQKSLRYKELESHKRKKSSEADKERKISQTSGLSKKKKLTKTNKTEDYEEYAPVSKKLKKNSKTQNNNENLSLYFDSEVNQILDKIKGYDVKNEKGSRTSKKRSKKSKPKSFKKKMSMEETEQIEEQMMSFKKQEEPEKVDQEEEEEENVNYEELERIATQISQEKKKSSLRPVSNEQFDDIIEEFEKRQSSKKIIVSEGVKPIQAQNRLSDTSARRNSRYEVVEEEQHVSQSEDDDVEYYPEMDTFGNKKEGERTESQVTHPKKRLTTHEDLEIRHENNLEPKRVTLVERSGTGMSVISQKLRPTLVGNEYYYQTVEEIFDKNKKRQVSVLTRNEKGSVISKVSIHPTLISNYYENKVTEVEEGLGLNPIEKKITLNVINDRGETVHSQTLMPSMIAENDENYLGDFEEIQDTFGHRKSTITTSNLRGTITKSHRLRPILVGNQYYQQIVEEVIELDGQRKVTLVTKTEKGDVVTVKPIDSKLIGDNYYSTIVNDVVTDYGQRKVTVMTCNDRHETLISQNFRPTGFTAIGRKYIKNLEGEILEEIVDAFGTRKITLISKNEKGENVVYQEIRPSDPIGFTGNEGDIAKSKRYTTIGDNFYEGAVERIMDDIQRRKTTGIARTPSYLNPHQKQVIEKMLYSKVSDPASVKYTDLGDEHYGNLVGDMVIDQTDISSKKVSIRPTQIGNNYYIEIVNENIEDTDPYDQITNNKSVTRKSTVNYSKVSRDKCNRIVASYLEFKNSRANSLIPFKGKPDFYDEMMQSDIVKRKITPINYSRIAKDEYNQIIDDHIQARKNSQISGLSKKKTVKDHYDEILDDDEINKKTEIDYTQIDRDDYNQIIDDFNQIKKSRALTQYSQIKNDHYDAIVNSAIVKKKESEIDYSKIGRDEYNQIIEDFVRANRESRITAKTSKSRVTMKSHINEDHYKSIIENEPINKKSTIDYSQIRKDDYNRIIDDYLEVCDDIGIVPEKLGGDYYEEIVDNNLKMRSNTDIDYSKIARDEYNQLIDDYLEANQRSGRKITDISRNVSHFDEISNDKSVTSKSVIDYSKIGRDEYNQIIDDYLNIQEEEERVKAQLDADFYEEMINNSQISKKSDITKDEYNQIIKDYIMSKSHATPSHSVIAKGHLGDHYDQILQNENVNKKSIIDYSQIGRDQYNNIIDDFMKVKEEEEELSREEPNYHEEILKSELVRKKTSPIDYSRIAEDEYNQIISDHLKARKNTEMSIRPKQMTVDYYEEIVEDEDVNEESPIDYSQINKSDFNQIIEDYQEAQKEKETRKDTQIGNDFYNDMINSNIVKRKGTEIDYSKIARDEYNQIIEDYIEAKKENEQSALHSRQPSKISRSVNSKIANSYYGKIIDNTVAQHKPEMVMRPTIIGDSYYGQIVNTMLDHESNKARSEAPSERSDLRPTQVKNEYYADLIEEAELHRQRLLTARSLADQYKRKTTVQSKEETSRISKVTKTSISKRYEEEKKQTIEELKRSLRESELPKTKQSLNYALEREEQHDRSKTFANKMNVKKNHSLIAKLDQDRQIDTRQSMPLDQRDEVDVRDVSKTMLVKDYRKDKEQRVKNTSLIDKLDQDREVDTRKSTPIGYKHESDTREVSKTMLVKQKERKISERDHSKDDSNVFGISDNQEMDRSGDFNKSPFESLSKKSPALVNPNYIDTNNDPNAVNSITISYPQQQYINVNKHVEVDNNQKLSENISIKTTSKLDPEDEDRLIRKITEAFAQEKDKLSEEIIKKLEQKMKGGGIEDENENLIDEFYRFCRETLPSDDRYKESIMFISLFYYFLEKHDLMKND